MTLLFITTKKLFASLSIVQKRQEKLQEKSKLNVFSPSIWHENKCGNISVLPFSCALRAEASHNYLLVNGNRRLSAREMLRLQGFPEDFQIVVSYTAIRRLIGNSVAIPVVQAVAYEMISAMENKVLDSIKSR